jgi:hypothetical protein
MTLVSSRKFLAQQHYNMTYPQEPGSSELIVHGTQFESRTGRWCALVVGQRPRISLEMGQVSMAMFLSLHSCINRGCLAILKPCPIRLVPSKMASYRLESVSPPWSKVSPAWKMNGRSSPNESALERMASSSGTKNARGRPVSSWPCISNPMDTVRSI